MSLNQGFCFKGVAHNSTADVVVLSDKRGGFAVTRSGLGQLS